MDLKECLLVGFFSVVILAPLSLSEHFELSSSPPVIGNVGQDVVLPCQISLGTQPQNMEVKWNKIGDKNVDDIYQFTAVTDQETFGLGYQTRAVLVTKEERTTGNVSLKMKKVQVNDEGTYRCIVKSSDWIAQTQTVLHVAALGNVSIEVLGPEGEGIKLACKSAGWFPEPELQWLAKNSQNPQLESKQDHEQLFSVWSNITVMRDAGEITCSVHERSHLQVKRESTILLSQNIFPHTCPWLPAFWVVFVLFLLAVGVTLYYRYKGNQKESKRKCDEEEERRLLESDMTVLKSENQRLKLDLEARLQELEEQKALLEKHNEEMTTVRQENHNLKKMTGELEQSLRKCEEEKERNDKENQDLERKLDAAKTELASVGWVRRNGSTAGAGASRQGQREWMSQREALAGSPSEPAYSLSPLRTQSGESGRAGSEQREQTSRESAAWPVEQEQQHGGDGQRRRQDSGEAEDLNRKLGFWTARNSLVRINMDPECKHPKLEMLPERKRVYCKLTSSEAATTSGPLIIAGTEGFQDGRQYWEVEVVEDEPNWEVGVLREDARDKLKDGKLSTLEKEQYWSLKRLNGKYYPEEVDHKIQEYNYQLQRIGIYLDREEGNVSFYHIKGMQEIVKIPVKAAEKLYPFFSAGLSVTEHV